MAIIRKYGLLSHLKSEASHHVIRFKNNRVSAQGRGLGFWFAPAFNSIMEVPLQDQETTIYVKGRSQDFQQLAVQGSVVWHVSNPEKASQHFDFTIELNRGTHTQEPLVSIEMRLVNQIEQIAMQYLASAPVRILLDTGVAPLVAIITAQMLDSAVFEDVGISIAEINLAEITPSKALTTALLTPTLEALQQKSDEAIFERRALAVDKERAISENELANRIELAHREKMLIAKEADNSRDRAEMAAQSGLIEANSTAERVRIVESAKAEVERQHMAVMQDLGPAILLGLAAREFATKLQSIEHLNVTPDMLSSLVGEFKKLSVPANPQA
jgi:hypothetical protein